MIEMLTFRYHLFIGDPGENFVLNSKLSRSLQLLYPIKSEIGSKQF